MQFRDHARTLGRWSSSRAWSRAGAVAQVAQVVAVGTPRRVIARSTRVFMFATGLMFVGFGVGVMLWNDIGPGPLDVFIGAVRTHTGLPLSVALWVTVGSLLALAWVLGRRPKVGSVIGPFAMGPVMQAALEYLEQYDAPSTLAARLCVHMIAIAIVGLGAGACIASGFGAGSGELLAAATSDRSGHPEPRVRVAFEMSWLVIGVALGGPIGVGTVIVALLIGPAVASGHRIADSFVVASRRQLDLVAA